MPIGEVEVGDQEVDRLARDQPGRLAKRAAGGNQLCAGPAQLPASLHLPGILKYSGVIP
jgi:hypothetical protein